MRDHILNMESSEQNYNIKMSISKHFLIYKLFNAVFNLYTDFNGKKDFTGVKAHSLETFIYFCY